MYAILAFAPRVVRRARATSARRPATRARWRQPADAAAAAVADFAKAGENLLHLPAEPERYGQALYTALHQLDQLDVQTILVEFTPTDESWAAVNDRLRRAAGTG